MIVLAGGFLVAVLVAMLVQASLSGAKKETPVVLQEEPKVQIVVASADIKTGAELSDENMEWHDWPKKAVFPGAIVREEKKKPSEMVSGRLLRDMKAGEPVVESALVPKTQGNFLAASLDEGMRAISIKVSPETMVGGFVGPGDYVDVILTYKQKFDYGDDTDPYIRNQIEMAVDNLVTETVLQNVKVLAVDQSAVRDQKEAIKVGKTVTLAVDFKGAEVIALAAEMGEMSLALRRLGDETVRMSKAPVTTDARLAHIDNEIFQEIVDPQGEDSAGQRSKTVRIYRGGMVEDIPVNP